jgi:L-fuconolactonase
VTTRIDSHQHFWKYDAGEYGWIDERMGILKRDFLIRDWTRAVRTLAAEPNVHAKLSGLVTEADWRRWTPEQIRPYLDVAFECFGPGRLMIGSDWPVCTLAGDYGRTMAVVTDYLQGRPVAEGEAVLGGNAREFWNLEVKERQ